MGLCDDQIMDKTSMLLIVSLVTNAVLLLRILVGGFDSNYDMKNCYYKENNESVEIRPPFIALNNSRLAMNIIKENLNNNGNSTILDENEEFLETVTYNPLFQNVEVYNKETESVHVYDKDNEIVELNKGETCSIESV